MRRQWEIRLDHPDAYGELEDAIGDLVRITLRLGGVGAFVPHRVEVAEGIFENDRVTLKYDSYVPGLNKNAASQNGEVPEEAQPELLTQAEVPE